MLALWLLQHHEAAADAAADAHGAAEAGGHGAEAAGHAAEAATHTIPELPNLLGVIHQATHGTAFGNFLDTMAADWFHLKDPMGTPFMAFETLFFGFLVIAGLLLFFGMGYRRLKLGPKEGQLSRRAMFNEIVVLFFDDFFTQIFGAKEVRKHLPFVGSLFIYILVCNTLGLIFMGKAPTANLSFNLGMAVLVFFYVHFTGISRGAVGYLKHYPGELPQVKDLGLGCMGYPVVAFMAVLFTVIHVLEALIQPLSLSLRLFGNVLGKDVLLGVFASLMPMVVVGGMVWVYFPWHTPFLFLGILLGTIQALIFSLLTAIYITLWLPHEHEHAEEH